MKKMKKSVKILLAVIATIMITGITVFAATIGKSTSSFVRIRQSASTESDVLDVLMEGDQVEILGEEGDWYKVSAKGHTGYVSKAFISKNGDNTNQTPATPETPANPETPATTPATTTRTATITTRVYKVAENTTVYILPILNSEAIGTVNQGEGLELLNSAGLWGYIKTDKIKGWVRIDKLSSEEVTQTVTEEVPVEETPAETKTEETKQEEAKPAETEPAATETAQTTEQTPTPAEQPAAEPATTEPAPVADSTPAPEPQPAAEPATAPAQPAYEEKTMYVSVTAINVRKEANTTSDVISGATLNNTFTVVGEENDWYKVKVNGNDFGYIRKDLLSDKKTEETSRSNTTYRTEAAKQTAAPATTQAPAASTQAAAASTQAAAPAKSSSGVTGADVVAYAQQFKGCRYVYGAAGPSSFDCSGFTMYVYKHFGYNLSHSSKVQATQGVKVTGELQPGDILVFSNDGKQVGHVGLYIGNDKFIHASDSTTGVIISNLHDSWNIKKYWGARRIIQ